MIVINELNMHHAGLNPHYYYGAIQDNPAYDSGGPQFDVFGTPFFRHVYAIFDVEKERFGVIPKDAQEMDPSPENLSMLDSRPQELGLEDSPDGNIRQEPPRRQDTILSIVEVESDPADEDIPERPFIVGGGDRGMGGVRAA
jgi:hypothetical protein